MCRMKLTSMQAHGTDTGRVFDAHVISKYLHGDANHTIPLTFDPWNHATMYCGKGISQCTQSVQRMRKLFLMCQTTGPAETRFLADPLAFWQTHCRCSFAHACGKNGEQWTISRSQGPVMDGCLPDPDKKYPLRSDGPANFAFSVCCHVITTDNRASPPDICKSFCWWQVLVRARNNALSPFWEGQKLCRKGRIGLVPVRWKGKSF